MKLNYAPQAGLRRRKPGQRRQHLAFWLGVAITVAFEVILMAKTWSAPPWAWGADAAAEPAATDAEASALNPSSN